MSENRLKMLDVRKRLATPKPVILLRKNRLKMSENRLKMSETNVPKPMKLKFVDIPSGRILGRIVDAVEKSTGQCFFLCAPWGYGTMTLWHNTDTTSWSVSCRQIVYSKHNHRWTEAARPDSRCNRGVRRSGSPIDRWTHGPFCLHHSDQYSRREIAMPRLQANQASERTDGGGPLYLGWSVDERPIRHWSSQSCSTSEPVHFSTVQQSGEGT